MTTLALVALFVGAVARLAIGRAAAASGRVDHYYWMIAAEAYRTQRGLPVRIRGKYLLEDEEQAYPPLFGFLLGRYDIDRWGVGFVRLLEGIEIVLIVALMAAFHAPYPAIALGLAVYVAAPVLVTYNTQLNSRVLADVFLVGLLAAEASAAFVARSAAGQGGLWCLAGALTALVILTHKMTLQVYAVLLLPWSWAIHSPMPLLAAAAGAVLYVAVVGRRFAVYQFRAQWDLVSYWNRHWRLMGAHQFRQSPVYGDPSAPCATCFHQPGWRGVLKHVRLIASYAPLHLVLPIASFATGSWPPAWLLVWLGVIYAWAFATLFVPRLKCLGGGHMYIFNAVAPGACYLAWLPDTPPATALLALGIGLCAVSLAIAWRIVRARPTALDGMFDRAVAALCQWPKGRVAVFPLQSAEAVAWATPHAVLWGGHGYGLKQLEPFFPVLTRPLSHFLREHGIDWVLCDDRFWRIDAETLRREGIGVASETVYGHWRLTDCRPVAAAAGGNPERSV